MKRGELEKHIISHTEWDDEAKMAFGIMVVPFTVALKLLDRVTELEGENVGLLKRAREVEDILWERNHPGTND